MVYIFLNFFLAPLCSLGDLSSQSGMERGPPAVEAWNPNHWTSREFPVIHFLFNVILKYVFVD